MNLTNINEGNSNENIDESQFTIEKVEGILRSFYFPQNNDYSNLPRIQEWLMLFQRSFSAWSIAPLLLSSNVREIQYFGASTIENKIKTSWLSLNTELKVEFLDRLLVFLKTQLSNCSTISITRLCLAVSVIACHSTPDLWSNPILDVLQFSFPDINNLDQFNPNLINLTLELLTIFPEELLNADYITQEKRNKVGSLFGKYSPKVFEVISKIMTLPHNQQTTAFKKLSLKSFKSWILFDCSPKEYLVDSQILTTCFEAVSSNLLLVEDFLMVLDELFTLMGGKIFRSYSNSFDSILEKILSIFPQIYMLALKEENQIFNQIFLLFTHIAENHIKLLLKNPKLSSGYFKALVEMALKGDFETCELLAPVVTEIVSLSDKSDISGWYQFLLEIVEIFRLKSMYPIDQDISSLYLEDQEKFFAFRQIAGDVLLDIFAILENQVLQQLLNQLWSDIQSYPNKQTCWQSIESTVYLLGCLSEGITENVDFIPQLFSLLGQLPIQSTPLIKSTMILAGKYSNLMDKSTQFLEKIVRDFFPAFTNPDLKSVASQSFLSISKNPKCAQLLSTGINQLIELCSPVLLKNNKVIIDEPSNFFIIEALLYIVSVLPTKSDILNYSTQLLSPFILYMKHYSILSQQEQPNEKPNTQLLLSSLNLLTDFCKVYDDGGEQTLTDEEQKEKDDINRPVYQIINHIISINGDLLGLKKLDNSIIEAISIFYKKAILISYNSNIAEINRQLTMAFNHTPLSIVLNSLSMSIASLPNQQPFGFLVESLALITNKMVDIWKNPSKQDNPKKHADFETINQQQKQNQSFLASTNLNEFLNFNLSIYPDITKEFFSLIGQYIKYNVNSIPSGVISYLFSIVLANITNINDKITARACLSFLSITITKTKEMKDETNWQSFFAEVNNWFTIHGDILIRQILFSAGGGAPRSQIQFVAEVIASLTSSYPDLFRQSALKILSVDGFPSNHITKDQKEKFLNSLMSYRNKKLPTKIIQDFSLVSLGISNKTI
ncbi:hypothetical protein DICPUDRAFT_75625 [Dictyostelium purpureum]|uniref:Importin N-terminal domain-containing protein n=1 Tax=Dictyostelium purpureum TaxID=5786 RepID=F0ZB72_DICPU|nr:uncharacterized protein DICPUDRAFT_75625 [Dictyostelium purpureum]EGC38770.1 hypothetical protein DICPUDRAFT_75625 [Dictyostelium purpureum]|eukprot:XP_003284664.1 hypothetical protein DICPUDRAFT_75625 [Dictyostelium purpureum]